MSQDQKNCRISKVEEGEGEGSEWGIPTPKLLALPLGLGLLLDDPFPSENELIFVTELFCSSCLVRRKLKVQTSFHFKLPLFLSVQDAMVILKVM